MEYGRKKTLWISHSAISAFTRCPHLYYLEYEYRNPETGNRIQITNPYLALGITVHEAIEGLLGKKPEERSKISLVERFDQIFKEYRGLKGGFISQKKEDDFYKRGIKMMERVEKTGFLSKPSIKTDTNFPTINLIGESVKLIGSIDWIEKLSEGGAHIIDFKTGNSRENNGSLQLPIYTILGENNIKEKVKKVSYWYLQHDDTPIEQELPDTKYFLNVLKEKASLIKEAISEERFPCNYGNKCFSCRDYEKIFIGEAERIESANNKNKDVFCIFKEEDVIERVMDEDFLDEREKKVFEMRMTKSKDEISRELRLTEEKADKIVKQIKEKLAKNLRQKELRIIIKLLSPSTFSKKYNGKKRSFEKN